MIAGTAAASRPPLEKPRIDIGIIPLTDCAPIAVAQERGLFARHGLDVTVCVEASWAAIRDKVAFGVLDGAQMLAGMPIASTLGFSGMPCPMIAAMSLDLNGNAITVSAELYDRMCQADPGSMAQRPVTARALKAVIDADRVAGRPPMTFASVFPVSSHQYQLLYWMAQAGIQPDRDVNLAIVPPPQMVEQLSNGEIAGYCVGEPWNQHAIACGVGRTVITSYEIWNNGPEKVFGVTRDWAEQHPRTHAAVIKALIEAAVWLDGPENRAEAARLVGSPAYVNVPLDIVERPLLGRYAYVPDGVEAILPDFNVFHRYAATFPWRSHAVWLQTQMIRWGQIDRSIDMHAIADAVYRPDVYRVACDDLGLAYPTIDTKWEGIHDASWTLADATTPIEMGADRFFDGLSFDPACPLDYVDRFPVAHAAKVNP